MKISKGFHLLLLPVLMAGCTQLPAIPSQLSGITSLFQARTGNSLNNEEDGKQTAGNKKIANKTAKPPIVPQYTTDKAMIDLLSADGRACTAASDAGTLGNMKTYAAVSLELSKMAVMQSVNSGDMQSALAEVKSKMERLAFATLWLPMQSEVPIGMALLKADDITANAGKSASGSIGAIKNEIKLVLGDYSNLAKEKYNSPYDFQPLYVKSTESTFAMYPGGFLIVPDNLLTFLSQLPENERSSIIRFQIGHEIAHALRRHLTKFHQFKMVDAGFRSENIANILNSNKGILSTLNPDNISQLFNVGVYTYELGKKSKCEYLDTVAELHKTQELEADVCSIYMISTLSTQDAKYGFNPTAAFEAYTRLKKRTSKGGAKSRRDACSTGLIHPEEAEREKNVALFYQALKSRKQ